MRAKGFASVLAVLAASLAALGGDALACGDKLIVVGRGFRGRLRSGPPASILLYADPKGSLPAALDQGHLRSDLERAGHRLRSVGTPDELKTALHTGSYDLVLADLKQVESVKIEAAQAASKPTVLPTLFNPTDAELAAASAQYQCLVKSPGQQKDYLTVVNEALQMRVKQARAERRK